MDSDDQKALIPCLSNFVDLQRMCEEQDIHLSTETNRYMIYLSLRKLGPLLAQKLIQKLVQKGEVKWRDEDDFEVEAILDYVKEESPSNANLAVNTKTEDLVEKESSVMPSPPVRHLYHVKWKGWAHEHNTWEPKENLENCDDLLSDFHKVFDVHGSRGIKRKLDLDNERDTKRRKLDEMMDKIMANHDITPMKLFEIADANGTTKKWVNKLQGLAVNGSKVNIRIKAKGDLTNKRTKAYKMLKHDVQYQLKHWEKHINDINTDPAPIQVENLVDLEGPPTTFTYINDYKPMEGIDIPTDPIVGCECEDCYDEKKSCCGPNAGTVYGYKKTKKVRIPPGHPIYECNKRCKCGPDCFNRVVQHGRKHKVCIFRTSNCRGWGVRALQRIPKGTFVMEYVGEVITFEEAERRGKVYDAEGMTYLFDLDYNDADCPFTVDAQSYGNVSHFVNHSCDPNLVVYGVWINHLDHRLPRIALFSKKDIAKGEELTFDYMMTGAVRGDSFNEGSQEIGIEDEEQEVEMQGIEEEAPAEHKSLDLEQNATVDNNSTVQTSVQQGNSETVTEFKAPCEVLDVNGNSPKKSLPHTPLKKDFPPNILEAIENTSTPKKSTEGFISTLQSSPTKVVADHASYTATGEQTPNVLQAEEKRDIMPPTPSESNFSEISDELPGSQQNTGFGSKRHSFSSPPTMKYRIRCQCGEKKCRQWLY